MQLVSNLLGSGSGLPPTRMWLRMTSQIFTPDADLDVIVHLVGAGGSGGASAVANGIATGGGAGGYAKKRVLLKAGVAYTLTNGAGLLNNAAAGTQADGKDGGNTSLTGGGLNIIAYGGKGGKTGLAGAAVLGGDGGGATGGDIHRTGGRGGRCASSVNAASSQLMRATGGGAVNLFGVPQRGGDLLISDYLSTYGVFATGGAGLTEDGVDILTRLGPTTYDQYSQGGGAPNLTNQTSSQSAATLAIPLFGFLSTIGPRPANPATSGGSGQGGNGGTNTSGAGNGGNGGAFAGGAGGTTLSTGSVGTGGAGGIGGGSGGGATYSSAAGNSQAGGVGAIFFEVL